MHGASKFQARDVPHGAQPIASFLFDYQRWISGLFQFLHGAPSVVVIWTGLCRTPSKRILFDIDCLGQDIKFLLGAPGILATPRWSLVLVDLYGDQYCGGCGINIGRNIESLLLAQPINVGRAIGWIQQTFDQFGFASVLFHPEFGAFVLQTGDCPFRILVLRFLPIIIPKIRLDLWRRSLLNNTCQGVNGRRSALKRLSSHFFLFISVQLKSFLGTNTQIFRSIRRFEWWPLLARSKSFVQSDWAQVSIVIVVVVVIVVADQIHCL
mmetsp:Transcript_2757/g.5839  ORF Transcript_2757/g.5839 Transcript_2757/m.5839 type:complete len:267 (+) Transcript_2757:194-994(+)